MTRPQIQSVDLLDTHPRHEPDCVATLNGYQCAGGCAVDMLTRIDDLLTLIDDLTRELAKREDLDARQDVVLDALYSLVRALPETFEREHSVDSRRVVNALSDARAVLAGAGRVLP